MISNLDHLGEGQIVEAFPIDKKANKRIRRARITNVDRVEKRVTVQTPDGKETVLNWLEFIIRILPLIDTLIFWIVEKVRMIRRKNKNDDGNGNAEIKKGNKAPTG